MENFDLEQISNTFLKYIESEEFFKEVRIYDEFLKFYVKNGDRFLGLGVVDFEKSALKIKCLTYHPSDDN